MKQEIIKLFKDLTTGGSYSHVYSADKNFYSRLQSLAGLVYNIETDSYMDNELKELSNYVQLLCNLKELEGQIRQLMPNGMDFRNMFNTGLDRTEHLRNLTQVTINFPQTITIPSQNQVVPEDVVNMVLQEFKHIKTFEFNVPKIISWIKSRIDFNDDKENAENNE